LTLQKELKLNRPPTRSTKK